MQETGRHRRPLAMGPSEFGQEDCAYHEALEILMLAPLSSAAPTFSRSASALNIIPCSCL